MTIKIDSDKVRVWRKERCWSQEQLAEETGLSLRTIQRIENGGTASNDTAVSLATAFEKDINKFTINQDNKASKPRRSKEVMGLRMSFVIHAFGFFIGGLTLFLIDLIDSSYQWWSVWPLTFWFIGFIAHGGTVLLVEFLQKMQGEMEELESAS